MENLNQRKKRIKKAQRVLRKNNEDRMLWYQIAILLLISIIIGSIYISYKKFAIGQEQETPFIPDMDLEEDFSISYLQRELVPTLMALDTPEEETLAEPITIGGEWEEPLSVTDEIGEPIAYIDEVELESTYYDESNYGLDLVEVFGYMEEVGTENNIPPEILQAIAKKESNFNPNAKSSTNDHGLMQINACNFSTLRSMGIEDFYNPYDSIDAAVIILNLIRNSASESKRNNWHYILMAYNMGQGNANRRWNRGQYSSTYSREICDDAIKRGWSGQ